MKAKNKTVRLLTLCFSIGLSIFLTFSYLSGENGFLEKKEFKNPLPKNKFVFLFVCEENYDKTVDVKDNLRKELIDEYGRFYYIPSMKLKIGSGFYFYEFPREEKHIKETIDECSFGKAIGISSDTFIVVAHIRKIRHLRNDIERAVEINILPFIVNLQDPSSSRHVPNIFKVEPVNIKIVDISEDGTVAFKCFHRKYSCEDKTIKIRPKEMWTWNSPKEINEFRNCEGGYKKGEFWTQVLIVNYGIWTKSTDGIKLIPGNRGGWKYREKF